MEDLQNNKSKERNIKAEEGCWEREFVIRCAISDESLPLILG